MLLLLVMISSLMQAKKVKAIFQTAVVVLVKAWAAHFLEERTISKKGCDPKI